MSSKTLAQKEDTSEQSPPEEDEAFLSITCDPVIQSGAVRFSWCSNAETIKDLSMANAHVLFCLTPISACDEDAARYDRNQKRVLHKFSDGAGYVEFPNSGEFKVSAFLIKNTIGRNTNRLAATLLEKNYYEGNYEFKYLKTDGNPRGLDNYSRYPAAAATSETYVIPEGVFAKPPSPREQAWVNMFFRSQPKDQCEFRKRRMFAYTIQPLFGLARSLAFALSGVLALFIGQLAQWRGVIHPFQHELSQRLTIGTHIASKLFPKARSSESFGSLVLYAVFTPLVWLIPILFVTLFLSASMMLLLILFACIAGAGGLSTGAYYAQPYIKDYYRKRNKVKREVQRKALVCGSKTKMKKPIRLQFYDLKAKVCRPFGR